MNALEKDIERKCRRIAERNGHWLLKIISPNRTGILDRLYVPVQKSMIWMEFKRGKGGSLSPQQYRTIKDLRSMGHEAHAVNSVAQFCEITGLTE